MDWWVIVVDSKSGPPKHGTIVRYNRGCHCDRCRAASAAKQKEYRARRRAASAVNVTPIKAARAAKVKETAGLVETEIHAALLSVGRDDMMARSLMAIAVSLARELDNPRGSGSIAPIATQLQALVKEALKGGEVGGSGLEGLGFLGTR